MPSIEIHLKYKEQDRLRMEKTCHANNKRKKARIVLCVTVSFQDKEYYKRERKTSCND